MHGGYVGTRSWAKPAPPTPEQVLGSKLAVKEAELNRLRAERDRIYREYSNLHLLKKQISVAEREVSSLKTAIELLSDE